MPASSLLLLLAMTPAPSTDPVIRQIVETRTFPSRVVYLRYRRA